MPQELNKLPLTPEIGGGATKKTWHRHVARGQSGVWPGELNRQTRCPCSCSHRPVAGLSSICLQENTAHRAVATGRSRIRAGDGQHFALVNPLARGCNKAGSDRVVTNVLPFLPVAFIAAQNVVETTLLPHLRAMSTQATSTRQRLFQLPNPAAKNKRCVAAHK